MKQTEMTKKQLPAKGNRSNTYYGLSVWMDIKYFARTKDGIQGEERTDPRIPIFNKNKIQDKLRKKFFEYGDRLEFNKPKIQEEWGTIIKHCNNKATNYFLAKFKQFEPCRIWGDYTHCQKFLPFDKETKSMIFCAEDLAYSVACSEIRKRQSTHDTWSIFNVSNDLVLPGFCEYENPGYVYLVRDEGKPIIKIGKTKHEDPRDRLRQGCTYAPDTYMMFSAFVENYEAVENNLKKEYSRFKYKNKNNRKEWFELSSDQVDGLITSLKSTCIRFTSY